MFCLDWLAGWVSRRVPTPGSGFWHELKVASQRQTMANACQLLSIYRRIPWTIDWLARLKWFHSFAIAGKRSLSWSRQSETCATAEWRYTDTNTHTHIQGLYMYGKWKHKHPCTRWAVVTLLLQLAWPKIAHTLHSSALYSLAQAKRTQQTGGSHGPTLISWEMKRVRATDQ